MGTLRRAGAVLACAALGPLGCSSPPESPLENPDAIGNDMGTLISIADIRSAAAELIQKMNADPNIARLRAEESPLTILLGEIRQYTTITNFDKRLFRNQLLAALRQADRDGAYLFLDRAPPLAEREVQARGEAGRGEPPPLRGARYVLKGEVREIFSRRPVSGGGEMQRRTVQYSLRLVRVEDGAIVWSGAHEIVKEQVIGLVYR